MARMRHARERHLDESWPPSPRDAAGRHVASSQSEVRSPAQNPCDSLYPPPADRHGAFGFCVSARSLHAHHKPRPPESESSTLVIHLLLKARAHADIFGTRVCRADSAWLGARARAGGRAHVAAVEGSWVPMY